MYVITFHTVLADRNFIVKIPIYFFINDIHLYYVQCGPEVMTLNEGAALVVDQIEKHISYRVIIDT